MVKKFNKNQQGQGRIKKSDPDLTNPRTLRIHREQAFERNFANFYSLKKICENYTATMMCVFKLIIFIILSGILSIVQFIFLHSLSKPVYWLISCGIGIVSAILANWLFNKLNLTNRLFNIKRKKLKQDYVKSGPIRED